MTPALSQWHESPRLQARARGVPGQLALWLAASALMAWLGAGPLVLLAFAAVMAWPARRRALLSLAAVGAIAERYLETAGLSWAALPASWPSAILVSLGGTAALYAAYRVALWYPHWPAAARRHPVLAVHLSIWAALLLSPLPLLGILGLAPFFAWRLSYLVSMAQRGQLAGTRFRDHLFYLVPVYGGTTTPYGKGLAFLSRHEAAEPQALAHARLAGLKLLLLAAVWTLLLDAMNVFVYGQPAVHLSGGLVGLLQDMSLDSPRLDALLREETAASGAAAWTTIYLELIRATLALASKGHLIVGALRLFGFNVFRNTYKPLLSESVLEFWNRYYYYFKELLVDFFFYPVYLWLRRLGPSTRLLAAVMAAAAFGNMYHHILADPELVIRFDAAGLWASWGPRLVYCLLLAFGIWVSMLRQKRLRASGIETSRLGRLRKIAGVWTFFALIQIWNIRDESVGITDCTAFFVSLFGM